QRLPNGNTLITEGSDGRIFEVTRDHKLVWEYISPYWGKGHLKLNMVYRAYRYPRDWVPQLAEPHPIPVQRLDNRHFRVPGGRHAQVPERRGDADADDGAEPRDGAPASAHRRAHGGPHARLRRDDQPNDPRDPAPGRRRAPGRAEHAPRACSHHRVH